MKTLQFILVCAGITALLLGISALFQHLLRKNVRRVSAAKSLTILAMSGALAGILMLLELPLVFLAPSFYKLDLSELPALICAFYLGPVAGVLTELLKIGLKLLLKGTTTAYVGELANFVIGCMLVVPASVVYHTKKSRGFAALGLGIGTLCMTGFGTVFNAVYLLPAFSELFSLPLDSIIAMGTAVWRGVHDVTSFVVLCVAPLNLVKGILLTILTLLLYKRIEKAVFQRL